MAPDAAELRGTIDKLDNTVGGLNSAVGDLKVAVAELKITVHEMRGRDQEDRDAAKVDRLRIEKLERWQNKVNGALIFISAGLMATGSIVAARVLGVHP